jgi:hypothetical protein
MWVAAGSPEDKCNPYEWAREPVAKKSGSSGKISVSGGPGFQFIEYIAKSLNVSCVQVIKKRQGKGGGIGDRLNAIRNKTGK